MTNHRQRLAILFTVASLLLSACNMPRRATPTQSGSGLIYTVAAQTVNAQFTQVNQPPGTAFVGATFTPSALLASATPLPPTVTLPPSTTPKPCDRGEFVSDVNFPDNTQVKAGESFVKTWRLRNSGSCTWTTAYALVFVNGEAMGAPAALPLTGNVAPGETIDISVSLKAPDDGGAHRGEFKLRNANNVIFGLGNEGKPFWVLIRVPVASGLLFDFLVQADAAVWTSGVGNDAGTALTFEGAAEDANGAAKIMDQVRLETGAISGKILLMFPRHDNNGYVTGLFPTYKVQNGDHFKARLGFMIPSGDNCGPGKAIYQLYYKEGDGELKLLKEWIKSCNGNLQPVDVDLSSLKGKDVRFAFTVRADGDWNGDWAIWNSPRIEH
jgi:hypothetical protein